MSAQALNGQHGPPHMAHQVHVIALCRVAAVLTARSAGEASGHQTKVPGRPTWWVWTFPWQQEGGRSKQNGFSRDQRSGVLTWEG